MSASHVLKPLDPTMAEQAAAMTFPAYHHMLGLQPSLRHPGEIEQYEVLPLGVAAFAGERMVGLALAEMPLAADAGVPELLSLFVQPELRNRGLATELVEAVEHELARRGQARIGAVYMTGKPSVPAIERVFAKRGWSAPRTRTVTMRFKPEEMTRTPWWDRGRLGPGFELFSWTEMTPEGLEEIRKSDERTNWVPIGLAAWRHGQPPFDPISSVGLRYEGEVVGWCLNHRIAEDTVRITCAFARTDLARRGHFFPILTEAFKRLLRAGIPWCSSTTPVEYPRMVDFVTKRFAPHITFFGETRGSDKELHAATEPDRA